MKIMKTKYLKNILAGWLLCCGGAVALTSCMSDLDDGNIDPSVQAEPDITALYSKCYACLILEGMDGNADFSVDNNGKSTFVRNLFYANCLTSDEAICWWSDGGLEDYSVNKQDPSSDHIRYLYYRIITDLSFCNHYMELPGAQADQTKLAEVRFIRAYLMYQLLDLYGDPSFIASVSSEMPKQAHAYNSKFVEGQEYTRAELLAMGREFLFGWVENELKTAEANMMEPQPKTDSDPNYGRVDKAAAWLMLSRLYLNAGTYLNNDGQNNPYWAQALEYAEKTINSPYTLFDDSKISSEAKRSGYKPYDLLFMGDNGSNGASCEAIFPLLQDGQKTKCWGGTMFFIATMWSPSMATVTGMDAGTTANTWSGVRCRPQLIEKFTSNPASYVGKTAAEIREMTSDDRAIFWGKDHTLSCMPNDAFEEGITTPKWNNNYSNGGTPHDSYDVDGDFFLLRLAEAYLNAAEAALHEGNADKAKQYIDAIRERAHATTRGSYSLDDVLDERSRELYFENIRRPDLIRYNRFGGVNVAYGWEGKGGNTGYEGAAFDKHLNMFPIPSVEILANTNLTQIEGF